VIVRFVEIMELLASLIKLFTIVRQLEIYWHLNSLAWLYGVLT